MWIVEVFILYCDDHDFVSLYKYFSLRLPVPFLQINTMNRDAAHSLRNEISIDSSRPKTLTNIFIIKGKVVKKSLIALAVTTALVGCGGSDSSSDVEAASYVTYQGKILDSDYIDGAQVCLSFNTTAGCDTDYVATTSSDGSYSIEVPESELESAQVVMVTAELEQPIAARSIRSASTISYSLISAPDQRDLIVTPFTTQVTNQMQLNSSERSDMSIDTQIALAQKSVIEQNDLVDVDSHLIFGDYIQDQVTDLQERAELARQWQKRAAELRDEHIANGALDDWDTVTVFVWNLWQHSYHTDEYFERYEEYVMYTNLDDDEYKESFTGTQWLVDEYGNQLDGNKLQEYRESSTWSKGTVKGHTFFTFDYDQDSVFNFTGERAFKGNYHHNDQGLKVVELWNLYNEGNPLDEGGRNEEGRIYCSEFDVVAALNEYQEGDQLDGCVDFVEHSVKEDTLQGIDLVTFEDAQFYFKDSSNYVNTNFVGYREKREFLSGLNGEQGTSLYKDWNAKSQITDEVKPHPYNQIKKDLVSADGNVEQYNARATWPEVELYTKTDAGQILQFSQINFVAWGQYAPSFPHETYKQTELFDTLTVESTPLNETMIYDNDNNREFAWQSPVVEGEDDKLMVVYLLDATWDKEALVYSADSKFSAITSSDEYYMDTWHGPENDFEVSMTLDYPRADAVFIDKSVTFEENTVNSKAFSPAIYSDTKWQVSNTNMPADLFGYIFGTGENYVFTSNTTVTATQEQQICWEENYEQGSMNSRLESPRGGDMVFSLYCNGWVDDNVYNAEARSQWLMSVTDVKEDGSFDAEIKTFAFGVNSFTAEPFVTYQVSFTK